MAKGFSYLGGGSLSKQSQIHNFKVFSYGNLYKAIQLLEMFLNYMNNKSQLILSSFSIECLEKFKPLVDILYL